jgi:D-alanine-D-alanine ligase
VFPALHGTFGEDGTLQRILESRRLRFVGSGSVASALAMDKVAAKQAAERAGVLTPPFETLGPADAPTLPPPLVVKPVDQGSSVGTMVVHEAADVEPAVARVCARFGRALVEGFIAGDELTVGIIGDRALPPICVRPKRGFYDYHAKYQAEDTEYLFDAGLPRELLARAEEWSLRVFHAIGARDLGRVDWIADGEGRLWFLELNTLPGFTSHSLVPKAAARIGVSFDELCDRLARMALGGAA